MFNRETNSNFFFHLRISTRGCEQNAETENGKRKIC